MSFKTLLNIYGFGFKDESNVKPDMFLRDKWPFRVWPKAETYRIIERTNRDTNQLQLQAFYKNEWVDVLIYDNGCDEYGQLYDGAWKKIGDKASWSERSLKKIVDEIKGKPEEIIISTELL